MFRQLNMHTACAATIITHSKLKKGRIFDGSGFSLEGRYICVRGTHTAGLQIIADNNNDNDDNDNENLFRAYSVINFTRHCSKINSDKNYHTKRRSMFT